MPTNTSIPGTWTRTDKLTAAQIRAKNKASGAYGTGNWTGESGNPLEPGTYYGNLAASPEGSTAAINTAAGLDPNTPMSQNDQWRALYSGTAGGQQPLNFGTPYNNTLTRPTGGGSGSSGGGGGGAATPRMTQQQLDWVSQLLSGGRPRAETATQLDLPDWQDVNITPFDSSQYDQLRSQLGQAVGLDRQAATDAYGNLTSYLNSNFQNPYANASYATSQNVPGQTQDAMQRMLAAQGQDPGLANDTYRQGQSADSAFGNLLALLGGNETRQQQNRLNAVQQDATGTNRALDIAQLQGNTAIGQQQGAARTAWQQRADDRALLNAQQRYGISSQEAQSNWDRANTVGDTNTANQNAYNNNTLSTLLGLLPQLISQGGTLNLPTLQALGLA